MIEVIDGFKVNKNVPIDTVRQVVATISDRDTIPQSVRFEGMETRVVATRTKYVLEGGIANSNWVPMVNSSIPDYAFQSMDEIRTLDITSIKGAVDVWLYPSRVYEWDVFSLLEDDNDIVLKPNSLEAIEAGRFILRSELAVKDHTHPTIIHAAQPWDGTEYAIDLSAGAIYKLKVNDLVQTLIFSLSFPFDADTRSRQVSVLIDNSNNTIAISSIIFQSGSWNWDQGVKPNGLAAGAVATLEIYNESSMEVKPNWTVKAI